MQEAAIHNSPYMWGILSKNLQVLVTCGVGAVVARVCRGLWILGVQIILPTLVEEEEATIIFKSQHGWILSDRTSSKIAQVVGRIPSIKSTLESTTAPPIPKSYWAQFSSITSQWQNPSKNRNGGTYKRLSPAGDAGLESFLREIRGLEQSTRKCYAEPLDDIDSNSFVKMLLLDGCFIIQFLLKKAQRQSISSDDPIFQEKWLFREIKLDLLYLENQIPFFLLERLYHLIASPKGINVSLSTVALDFFQDVMRGTSCTHEDPKHLLHLFHSHVFPDVYGPNLQASLTDSKPIPAATQLIAAAGMELRSSSVDLLYITFEDGVVRIPNLFIERETYSLFFNLIALEKLYHYIRPQVMACTFFMHCLINTAEDVAALCSRGIIHNWLYSDEEVVDLFNELGRDFGVHPSEVYLADVIVRIHEYYENRRQGWRAGLRSR